MLLEIRIVVVGKLLGGAAGEVHQMHIHRRKWRCGEYAGGPRGSIKCHCCHLGAAAKGLPDLPAFCWHAAQERLTVPVGHEDNIVVAVPFQPGWRYEKSRIPSDRAERVVGQALRRLPWFKNGDVRCRGNQPGPIGRPCQGAYAAQALRPELCFAAVCGDHVCFGEQRARDVAVVPAAGYEGDPSAIRRPDGIAVVPVAVGEGAHLAAWYVNDEDVAAGSAPPSRAIETVPQTPRYFDTGILLGVVIVGKPVRVNIRHAGDDP